MKVFISWSGTPSKSLAHELHTWLPQVLQRVDPFYSPVDVYKGHRWSLEVAKELEAAQFGLLCITRDNIHKPWLVFEAGALSRKLESGRVCPLLFDLEPSDVDGPLAQFQTSKFEQDEVYKLVYSLNSALPDNDARLSEQRLLRAFEKWWPDLRDRIELLLAAPVDLPNAPPAPLRTDRQLLDDMLVLLRQLARRDGSSAFVDESGLDASAIRHSLVHLHKLLDELLQTPRQATAALELFRGVYSPLRFIVDRGTFPQRYLADCKALVDRIDEQLGPTV